MSLMMQPHPSNGAINRRRLHLAGALGCVHAGSVDSYIAGSMSSRTQAEFELHMLDCETCLRATELQRLLSHAIREYGHKKMRTT
jgi:hypothetical protein